MCFISIGGWLALLIASSILRFTECLSIETFSQDYDLHLLMAQILHQRKSILYVDVIDVYQPTNIWQMYLPTFYPLSYSNVRK